MAPVSSVARKQFQAVVTQAVVTQSATVKRKRLRQTSYREEKTREIVAKMQNTGDHCEWARLEGRTRERHIRFASARKRERLLPPSVSNANR